MISRWLLLALLATSSWVQADALERILARGVLEVGAYNQFPPYSYLKSGRRAGIDVDIATLVGERLGVAVGTRLLGVDENLSDDLRNNVWKGHYMGGGTVDMMLHVPFAFQNDFSDDNDQVRFLTPYYREQIALFALDGNDIPETVAEIDKELVGVELDTLADFYLSSGSVSKHEVTRHYANLSAAVPDFTGGKLDLLMGPQGEIEGILHLAGVDYEVQPVTLPGLRLDKWDVGMAIKSEHQDLIETVIDILSDLQRTGAIAEVFENHGVTYREPTQFSLRAGYTKDLSTLAPPEEETPADDASGTLREQILALKLDEMTPRAALDALYLLQSNAREE